MGRKMKKWKVIIKGITAFLMAAVIAMSQIPGTDFVLTAYADSDKTITGLCTGAIGNPDEENGGGWSYVYYGTYKGKQVKYRVLTTSTTDFEGRTMLLDCDSTIVNMQFGDEYYDKSNKWSDSAIIRWLHGDGFCESVFTPQENAAIASSTKISPASGDGNGWSGTLGYAALGGERIFLLDAVEATRPSYGYANTATSDVNRKKSGTNTWWWLRSPYFLSANDAGYVSPAGHIFSTNVGISFGVSPAFNINLGPVIFSSLISGNAGNAGAEYKLTIADNKMNITPGTITRDGTTITVPYTITGTNAGNANRVSVLITDSQYSAGTAVTSGYTYKKLAVNSWSTSGTGTFTLPDEYAGKIWGSDYHVYILAEQAHTGNEIKLTDYASEPVEIKAITASATGYEGTYGGSGGNTSAGKVVTASDNEPMVYLEETRGDFRISYYHEIPLFGKAKADPSFFGGIKVSYGGKEYKATKIKVNKKKGLIRITGLNTADKKIVKAVKKATGGSGGLPFKVNPYYVRNTDTVTPKFKKDGSLKSIRVRIRGKDYKVKKGEFSYDKTSKTVSFSGSNLNGGCRLP